MSSKTAGLYPLIKNNYHGFLPAINFAIRQLQNHAANQQKALDDQDA
jgi:hypothetical protein